MEDFGSPETGMAIDLSKSKRRRKRIFVVRRSNSPSATGEKTQPLSVSTRNEDEPEAPASSTPRLLAAQPVSPGSPVLRSSLARSVGGSPKHRVLVATRMPKYSAERRFKSSGMSPLKSPTRAVVDDHSGKVLERRILGTADDYIEMFTEENPGVPLGYDVSRLGADGRSGAASGMTAASPQPTGSPSAGSSRGGVALVLDADKDASQVLSGGGSNDPKRMLEMVAAETVAANRSTDPYRYRLESTVIRAARNMRIEESRRREKDEEAEDESEMLVCDRVVEQREAHALANWKKMQVKWAKFKDHMSRVLKKHPDDLVLSRAEEYREKREEYDLIDNATPFHLKHGSEYWMMSLRGVGTRYVPVGNIFSGLFCPVHEDKISEPLVIRAPRSRVPLAARTDHPKNWRDSKTLVEKQRGLRKRIDSLRPHIVETEQSNALIVGGIGLFDWAQGSSEAYYREQDAEATRQERANEAAAGEDTTAAEETVEAPAEGQTADIATGGAAQTQNKFKGPRASVAVAGQPTPSSEGAGTTVTMPNRLLLSCEVGSEVLRAVTVSNTGSTALFIAMSRQDVHANDTNKLRGNSASCGHIHCHLKKGGAVVLPSQSINIPFSFRSDVPGVFSEEWHLRITPEPTDSGSNPNVVFVRAVATEEDTGSTRRAALEDKLLSTAQARASEEAREAERKKELEPKQPVLSAEEKERAVFEKHNMSWFGGLPVHYSRTTFGEFKQLFKRVSGSSVDGDVDASADWSGSLANLTSAIGNDPPVRSSMQVLEQTSLVPLPSPTSSSSWDAASKLLMSVALAIPEISDRLRADASLEVKETWKRPRNLKGGKRAVVPLGRSLGQMCGAWARDAVVTEDGTDASLTPEQSYRSNLCAEVAKMLTEGLDGFVDEAMASASSMMLESRKQLGMLMSSKLKLWKERRGDEEDEDEEEEEEEQDANSLGDGADAGEASRKTAKYISPEAQSTLSKFLNARVLLRIDASAIKFDVDAGVRVVSDESVATELAMQHAMDAVQQLLDAGAGTITVVGTHSSFANESFKPLANALSESLDRPVRFVDSDEKAMGIITEFEGKREAKAKARAARELRIAEKAAAAEVRRQARLEAGGNADEDEDDEDEDEEDEDEDEDDEDEEGNCPIIVLENRSLMKPEQVAYRTELHALAEEEDIAERNREMDSYLATLEEMCDIFVNNDMAGSGRTDVTVSGVKARLNLYVAGPRLQQELTIMEQVVEKVPRPAFGIVGGKSLRDNVVILNSLIDKLDEIMLGAHLSPLFERVMRERFFAANPEAATIGIASDPINVPDVGAVVAGDATTDISSTAADIAAVNTKAYSTGEFVVLTPDEDALLPVVRYLVSKAVGKGVRIHTAQDYTIGNLPPTSRDDGGFEMEYAGEVSEFIVTPLISGSAETADDAVGIENGRAGGAEEEDGDEDEEEDDELEDGEAKLAPDDPRVVRASFGMPASNVHVLDIGPSTQEAWAQALSGVKSVLWIGALGAVEYQDFCAGSQAVLDALMPEDGEGDADETDADQTAGDGGVAMPWVKPTVTLVGERLVGALRAAGMADEDLTLVSSCSVETVTDLVCGELSGLARLAEMAEAEPEAEQEPREAKLSDS